MNVDIQGIHLEVNERTRQYIEKKLARIDYAKDHIIDLQFRLLKEGSGFKCQVTFNFRWGNKTHLEVECYDLFEGIDKLIDKMEIKINREKSKVQEHS